MAHIITHFVSQRNTLIHSPSAEALAKEDSLPVRRSLGEGGLSLSLSAPTIASAKEEFLIVGHLFVSFNLSS